MDVKKMVIDMTKERTLVYINDEEVSCIQRLNVLIDAESAIVPSVTMSYWSTIGTVEPLKALQIKEDYAGVYGAYATPFTGNVELNNDSDNFVEDEES